MNSTKKERKKMMCFRIDKKQLDLIDEIVIKNSSTRSEVIRKLLKEEIARAHY